MVQGIDVSRYQGDINWQAVKSDGIEFAILKAMKESSRKPDEFFERNFESCVANGIKVGIYIYVASRSIEDTQGEIKAVLDILNGRKLPYGIWLDLEDKTLMAIGKDKITRLVDIEAETFKKAGYKVGIYSNRNWYLNVLDRNLFKRYPFWCARYPRADVGKMEERLSPKDYAQAWQYSSKGHVKGIKGNVDRDVDFVGLDK